jgi:hypothetical protein
LSEEASEEDKRRRQEKIVNARDVIIIAQSKYERTQKILVMSYTIII